MTQNTESNSLPGWIMTLGSKGSTKHKLDINSLTHEWKQTNSKSITCLQKTQIYILTAEQNHVEANYPRCSTGSTKARFAARTAHDPASAWRLVRWSLPPPAKEIEYSRTNSGPGGHTTSTHLLPDCSDYIWGRTEKAASLAEASDCRVHYRSSPKRSLKEGRLQRAQAQPPPRVLRSL